MLLTLTAAAAGLLVSCTGILRYPAVDPEGILDPEGKQLAFRMDPWLLSDLLASKLVVEIDWVEGLEPTPMAVEALERTIEQYGPPGREFEVVLSDEIPRSAWDETAPGGSTPLVERYLDANPHPGNDTALVYVLYLPFSRHRPGRLGQATSWFIQREGLPAMVRGAEMFREQMNRQAILWITEDRIDRSVLVHEFGHLLGLVRNDGHGVRGDPSHCTEVHCGMTPYGPRPVVANFLPGLFAGKIPLGYSGKCQADIRTARQLWQARTESDPTFVELLRATYYEELARRLRLQWNRGDWESAELLTFAARSAYPDRPEFLVNLAHFAIGADRRQEAIDHLRKAASLGHPAQRPEVGAYLCRLGLYDEATRIIIPEALETVDLVRQLYGYADLVWSLEGAGRFDEALQLGWGQDRTRVRLFLKTGQPERAEQILSESRERGRYHHFLWALVARASGREDEARGHLQQAVNEARTRIRQDRRSTEYRARTALATALALLGRGQEAREAVEDAAALAESSKLPRARWEVLACRARVHAILGEHDAALDALRNVPAIFYSRSDPDPCIDEYIEPLRDNPRFRELFPRCPKTLRE
jgi:tetratricopeptide (TPR) repeat protein